jgi:hypothetical protein
MSGPLCCRYAVGPDGGEEVVIALRRRSVAVDDGVAVAPSLLNRGSSMLTVSGGQGPINCRLVSAARAGLRLVPGSLDVIRPAPPSPA